MKYILILVIGIGAVVSSCTRKIAGDEDCIKISNDQQHEFLVDHQRKLISMNFDGDTIDIVNLYPDNGSGCQTHLFSDQNRLIVIDCNGYWYSISQFDMKIKNDGWKWEKKLPENYIGVLTYNKASNNYFLEKKESSIGLEDVYQHNDPDRR